MNDDVLIIWEMALNILKNECTSISFDTWVKPLKPLYMDSNSFTLAVADAYAFNLNMIKQRYGELIKNTIIQITGKEYIINFVSESKEEPKTAKNTKAAVKENNVYDPSSKYTFDNFIEGNSNRYARAASVAVAELPAQAYNPLFIYGGVGLGKTHLMHAIKNFAHELNNDLKIEYVSSEIFTNELIIALKDRKIEEFRNKYRSADILLVDDIQFIAGKTATEEEFFHTFNSLKDGGSQIVLSSDRPPNEIKTLAERLRSRFEWGIICDIAPPDFETRVAILNKKAENDNIVIDIEILKYIAEKVTSNIRELEGVFNRVVAYRKLANAEITISIVENLLKDYIKEGKTLLTPEYIVEYCSNFYKISPEKVYSTSQKKDVSFVRQISIYICQEMLDISSNKLGSVFGRDHSTVLHSVKKIKEKKEKDSVFAETIDILINDIKKNTEIKDSVE